MHPSKDILIAFSCFVLLLLFVGATSFPTLESGKECESFFCKAFTGTMSANADMVNVWLRVFVALVLPILFSGVFLLFLVRLFKGSLSSEAQLSEMIGHGLVFGLIGLAIAILFLLNNSAFQSLLPQFVLGATVLFQLLGYLREDWKPPINSIPSIAGAAVGLVSFLFGVLYLPNIDIMKEAREILVQESVRKNESTPTQ